MRKTIMLLAACLAGSIAYAKHDGWYVNTLTENFRTEHLAWDKTDPPLKVLFYVRHYGARDVVELAQRMNLEYTPYLSDGTRFYIDNVYAAALTGNSQFEKSEELREKAGKDFDVIVLGNVPFVKAPADAQFRILLKVKNGTGLIVHGRKLPYKKIYAKRLERPAFLDEAVLPFPEKRIEVYRFGKGRILQINDPSANAAALTVTFGESGIRARARQENELVFLMRALQWAAGKDVTTGKVTMDGDGLKIPAGAVYRIRDEFNRILAQGSAGEGKVSMAGYANGTYYCDLIIPGKACSVFEVVKSSALGKAALTVSSKYLRGKAPFTGEFAVEKAADRAMTLELTLADHPHGRIWEKKSIAFPAGEKKVSFEFKNYRMPNEAGALYAVLKDADGKAVAKAEETIFFPSGRLPVYFQTVFGHPVSLNAAGQLADKMGFGIALVHPQPSSARNLALRNEQLIPYLVRITMTKGPQGNVRLLFLTAKEKKAAAAIRDQSFYNPAIRKLWKDQILERMKGLPEMAPVLYSLGDENVLGRDSGYGASDLPAFRSFVEKKYDSIAKLNENWGTAYKSFEEVPHRTLGESAKDRNFAEWNDHCEYMERQFADIHHYSARIIKENDPFAKVGLEGTFGGHDIELMMEKLDWWGPYTKPLEDQLLRSLYSEVPRFVWSGYHAERTVQAPLMDRHILLGSVNGNGWYAAGCDYVHDIMAVDQSPSYPKSFMDELQRLRFGMAQMLITNKFMDSGLGLWWSHSNSRSGKVDERCVSPESGVSAMIQFCNAAGAGFEFVTPRTAQKRLKQIRVLMLMGTNALSDRDAELILDFVKKGGTVIADLTPAMLNENLAIRKNNPLAPLFGNKTLAETGKYAIRKLEIPGLKADKALVDPERKFMETVRYGKGKAILANFNFNLPLTSADSSTPFVAFLSNLLTGCGVRIPYGSSNHETVFRVRDGKGFRLIGLHNSREGARNTVTLPEEKYIYESGKGFVAKAGEINTVFSAAQPLRVYAVFDQKQQAPEVEIPSSVKAGENIRIAFGNLPFGRTVVIRVGGPDGKDMPERGVVLNTNDGKEYLFGVPYNAVKGKYLFTVTDYVTGLSASKDVFVK